MLPLRSSRDAGRKDVRLVFPASTTSGAAADSTSTEDECPPSSAQPSEYVSPEEAEVSSPEPELALAPSFGSDLYLVSSPDSGEVSSSASTSASRERVWSSGSTIVGSERSHKGRKRFSLTRMRDSLRSRRSQPTLQKHQTTLSVVEEGPASAIFSPNEEE